jgi:hypothetical protein
MQRTKHFNEYVEAERFWKPCVGQAVVSCDFGLLELIGEEKQSEEVTVASFCELCILDSERLTVAMMVITFFYREAQLAG